LNVLNEAIKLTEGTGEGLREIDDITFRNLVTRLAAAKSGLEEILEPATRITQRAKDIENSLAQIFSKAVPKTPYDDILSQLEGDIEDRERILSIKVSLEGLDQAFVALDTAVLERQRVLQGIFVAERKRLLEAAKLSSKVSTVQAKLDIRATSRQKARRGLLIQELQLRDQLVDQEAQIETMIKTRLIDKKAVSKEDIEQLEILRAKSRQYAEQIKLVESQLSSASKIGLAAKEGLEQNLNTNIYDLIVGDETSFKDAVLKTARGVLETIAKELSGQLTDSIVGALGLDLEDQRIRDLYNGTDGVFTLGAQAISGAVEQTITDTIARIQASPEIERAMKLPGEEPAQKDPLILRGRDSSATQEELKKAAEKTEGAIFSAPVIETTLDKIYNILNSWNPYFNERPVVPEEFPGVHPGLEAAPAEAVLSNSLGASSGIGLPGDSAIAPSMATTAQSVTIQAGLVSVEGLDSSMKSFMPETNKPETVVSDTVLPEKSSENKVAKELPNRFQEVTKTFGKRLETIFSAENPLLKGLGGIFEGLLKNIGSLFRGGIGGGGGEGAGGVAGGSIYSQLATSVIGLLFANGGVATGGFRAFATGGVADRPTVGMIGEGRFNEAVVPLPDGRSIPVEMTKGSGQQVTNSVNLSIDMGSGQSRIESDDQKLTQFGNVITELVQRELVDQSRPGGLLAR
jgi:hypothetical protein